MTAMDSTKVHTVAVIAFNGISSFHLSVPCIVFGDNLTHLGIARYRLLICSEKPGLVSTLSGFDIMVNHDLSVLSEADIVIMPAWRDPAECPPEALLQALRSAHKRGSRIVGLCLGSFVLAEAGLLDGRTASTHWVWANDFTQKYPHITLDQKALFVDDGDILTSAGTAAAIDCCLHLLRCDHGSEVANHVARRLVVAPCRHGNQAQYLEQPLPKLEGCDLLSKTLDWAIEHLEHPLCLDQLAARAGLSRRNFTRRFKMRTGTTVTQWLLSHRLSAAQRLLETCDKPLEHIADIVGFGSTVSLRRNFTAAFSISPSAYRKQFRQT